MSYIPQGGKTGRYGVTATEHRQFHNAKPTDAQSRSAPNTSIFTEATRQGSALSPLCEHSKVINGAADERRYREQDSNPVVHTRSDLTDILLENNKLQARLTQFTSNISPSTTTTYDRYIIDVYN